MTHPETIRFEALDSIEAAEGTIDRHEQGHELYALEHLLRAIALVLLADYCERHGIPMGYLDPPQSNPEGT